MKVFDNLEAYAAEVGNEIGVSEWMVIDQDRINKFAEATGDHQWIHLDGERTQRELGMPTIAHGFLTLSDIAEVQYKTTEYWFKEYEKTIIWNDPNLKIGWPIDKLDGMKPKLSTKDLNAATINEAEDLGFIF